MYQTLRVRRQDGVCFIQLYRPEANNTINPQLIAELDTALGDCETSDSIVVLEGLPEVFCFGADFQQMSTAAAQGSANVEDPARLYDLWSRLATGPYVTIAHVRGKTNAGGMGFVAACDIVLADESARFSLSELLFGVYPACVLPFLIRRIGFQRAHYLTLVTQPIEVRQAQEWGLVDACEAASESLVRKHLLRLRRLSKPAIRSYKEYANSLQRPLADYRAQAVEANLRVFSDARNMQGIARYVATGLFPWEAAADV